VKATARQQIMRKVNASANMPAVDLRSPPEGWIATIHMALEKQSIGYEKNLEEIEKLTEALVRLQPSDLWT